MVEKKTSTTDNTNRLTIGKSITITEAVLLAACTPVAFLLTYAYEWGWALALGYPIELIYPTGGQIAIALIFLLGSLASFYIYIETAYDVFSQGKTHLIPQAKIFFILCWAVAILLYPILTPIFSKGGYSGIVYIIIIIIASTFSYVLGLYYSKRKPPSSSDSTDNIDINCDDHRLLKIPSHLAMVGFVLCYLIVFAVLLGRSTALTTISYYTLQQNPSQTTLHPTIKSKDVTVVLRIYGERLVCGTIKSGTRELIGTIAVKTISDNIILVKRDIGPLSPFKLKP